MKVVIAEKPSMGKDIARVIGATKPGDGYMEGNGYKVTWAFGHLVELEHKTATKNWAEDTLPLMDDFILQPKPDVGKQIKTIDTLFKEADEIICATDAGREGELIFRYLYHYLKCSKPVKRLWISSLTDAAIKEGFSTLKPGAEYDALYDAAKARSESDWLVGVNATRALTLSVHNGDVFSLGRVQTPTLAIICKRFLDNKNFVSKPFWQLYLRTSKNNVAFTAKSSNPDSFETELEAKTLQEKANGSTVTIKKVETKEKTEKQPLPYDLTGLQKAASQKYSITPDKTLQLAQSLYESKYISYPRTGSCYIPDDVFANIPNLIERCRNIDSQQINAVYYQGKPELSKNCVNAGKVTDHHALLPTENLPDLDSLTKPERTVYLMIVSRMLEAFHQKCIKDVTTLTLTSGEVDFVAKGSIIKQWGWREVQQHHKEENEETDEKDEESELPAVAEGETLPIEEVYIKESKTKPQPLLNDATLLAYMETAGKDCEDEHEREAMKDCGIGTPATRDAIIRNLLGIGKKAGENYIIRDKKSLVPTEKALATYDIIKEKSIGSASLTGNWEKRLMDIQNSTLSYNDFMVSIREFTKELTQELSVVSMSVKSQARQKQETMPLCPKCKENHLHFFEFKKEGKNIEGMGCSKECGFTLWRTVAGKKLTDAQLITLVEKKATPIIKGFTSKAGKPFDAKLILKPDFTTGFEFPKR